MREYKFTYTTCGDLWHEGEWGSCSNDESANRFMDYLEFEFPHREYRAYVSIDMALWEKVVRVNPLYNALAGVRCCINDLVLSVDTFRDENMCPCCPPLISAEINPTHLFHAACAAGCDDATCDELLRRIGKAGQ